jgi:hypothetical protein
MQLPNIATVAWAVQGDQLSRQIVATLVDGSAAWEPQSGYHGAIRAHKPDGTSCFYDVDESGNPAVTWNGNVATLAIVQQALTAPGTVLMQLEFYDSNNARISAFGWAMNVQPSAVTDNEFLSSDYYNILTLQIAGVLGATGHAPYINPDNKNWMLWDDETAQYIDSGYSSEGTPGTPGPAPVVTNTSYHYANSNSGTVVPSSWSSTRPGTVPGTWAWTKTTITFNDSETTIFYSAAYQGNDGTGAAGSAIPLMDGTASAGSATAYSREDHVHPVDTSRASASDVSILQTAILNKVLYFPSVSISAGSGDIATITNAAIDSGHVLVNCVFNNPSRISTDITWTTSDTAPQFKLNGTCTAATTANITLAKKDN